MRRRDANPFFRLMGIDIGDYGNGRAELYMTVRPDMHNGVGWLQGGLYTALCDEAMALALFTVLDKEAAIATISQCTSFMQGVRNGRINAAGEVVKRGKSVAFMRGRVSSEAGESLAECTASFAILPSKKTA
ncbi:MAG: Thioesterase superfamily protein [Euryarchaeota archaeon ADurb.Bin190]|nr:MAG: Thioesterase superfamily protein [Euryarchaeota archaeon ADurb.Bin190]